MKKFFSEALEWIEAFSGFFYLAAIIAAGFAALKFAPEFSMNVLQWFFLLTIHLPTLIGPVIIVGALIGALIWAALKKH